ncbi:MAG TPA: hypothetical protein VI306_03880 [Pyrinomonadaceae bacterium]
MKTRIITLIIVVVIVCGGGALDTRAQEQSRLFNSDGHGKIRIGNESFKVSSVIVKLIDDHQVEVTLISEITIFLKGTWSDSTEKPRDITLEITGGASAGGLEAKGHLTIADDDKSIVMLIISGQSRRTKRVVGVDFKGN